MKVDVYGIERTAIKFIDIWGNEILCTLEKRSYENNGNLAIYMYFEDEWGAWEPYGLLTINLNYKVPSNRAFIDANKNPFSIVSVMKEAGYMKETGIMKANGFCIYPLYEFSQDFLDQLDKEYKEGGMIY